MKPIYKILDWIEEENKDVETPVKYKILCSNCCPEAMSIIENKIDNEEIYKMLDWSELSRCKFAFEILLKNQDKINWEAICCNDHENVMDLIKNNQNKIEWKYYFIYSMPEISSVLTERLNTKKKIFKKIDWYEFSKYTNDFSLFDKYPESKVWEALSQNPNAIHILEKNLDKISWDKLSRNPNAIKLLEENQDKIDWYELSANPNAIDLMNKNEDKIQEAVFNNIGEYDELKICRNPNAVHIIEKNLDKLNDRSWILLNLNPNAVHLIERYGTEKICWEKLLENPNALDLIKKFKDNKCEDNNYLDFKLMLYMNPSIFQLDKVAMKKQIEPLAKELIEKVLHPSRVIRILNEYKYNIVSDEYWCN